MSRTEERQASHLLVQMCFLGFHHSLHPQCVEDVHKWVCGHTEVVTSPMFDDTLLVKKPDGTKD